MNDQQSEASEAPLITHLIELRNRLLYSIYAVAIVFAALAFFAQDLYVLVAEPLMSKMPEGTSMIATEVASPFLTPIKLTFWVSLILAMPFVLYQLWAFIAPGLYRHEQRMVLPLVVSSTLLFYLGMLFAYFVVFPLVFAFFTQVAPAGVQVMTDIRAYLDFIFGMFLAFGIAFEVPVALILLTGAGVVNPDSLAKKRPYVVLWTFVIAMLLTPPDVFSQTLLAIPMLLLFEVGLFFARRMKKRKVAEEDAEEEQEMSDADMEAELERYQSEEQDGSSPPAE
jgi:sec-independent protein translocase protein TatC